MSEIAEKGSTPREKYIKTFKDGFFDCLRLCLNFALEHRHIRLLQTAQEQQIFFYKFLYSLRRILVKYDFYISEKETEFINKEYKDVLWKDYLEHEEEYIKILDKQLETAKVKIEDEDKSIDKDESINDEDTPCCDEECCNKNEDMCVEPNWKEECIKLQHELYKTKRTIEGLEYALYKCIPYDDRCPKR